MGTPVVFLKVGCFIHFTNLVYTHISCGGWGGGGVCVCVCGGGVCVMGNGNNSHLKIPNGI